MKGLQSRRAFINKVLIGSGGVLTLPSIGFGSSQKKITLIGDSIMRGYQSYTDLYLMDKASIWTPENDCKHTVNILDNAYEWFFENSFDIIQINAGLYDARTIPKTSVKNLVPIEQYAENIKKIIKYIHRAKPEAIIIWATTTPIMEDRTAVIDAYGISNENIIRYNEIAQKTVTRMGIPVNDLFQFVMDGEPEHIMADDGIHFTDTGYQFLGEQVANALGLFL